MPGGAINITIGGNAQQLTQAAAQATQALSGLAPAGNAAAAGLTNAGTAAAAAGRSIGGLAPASRPSLQGLTLLGAAGSTASTGLGATTSAATAAAAALSRVRPGANQAGAALTNVGRVAQDLPFGFIGIQNNLNPLLESFQRLRAETGSNRLALRALGSSLIGAGGIGLALSVVSSAIVIFQNGIAGFNKKTKEAADRSKEFVESLKSVADVAGQSAAGVQGQITQVQALANVVTNANNSYDQRASALRELQQINKSYFGDLKLEESQMGTLTARVNEYTQALVQQAVVKGFETELGKVSTGLYDQEKALKVAETAYKRLRGELERTRQTTTSATGEERVSQQYINLKKSTDEARKAFELQRDVVEKTRGNLVELKGAMQGAVIEGLKFRDLSSSGTKANKEEEDALKKRIAALKELQSLTGLDTQQRIQLAQLEIQLANRDSIKAGFTAEELQQQIEGIIENAFPVKTFEFKLDNIKVTAPKLELEVNASPADVIAPFGIAPNAFDGVVDAIRLSAEIAKNRVKQISIDLKAFLTENIANAFASLGEGIAAAFQGGGLQGVIAPLISTLGDAISALGKAAIAAGTAALLLKETLNNFIVKNPALVIAAGVAAVALGALLKNSFNNTKTPAFADGVTNFSGGRALIGERGPEILELPAGANITPLSPFQDGQQPPPSLFARGDDLYLVYNRTAGRRRRI